MGLKEAAQRKSKHSFKIDNGDDAFPLRIELSKSQIAHDEVDHRFIHMVGCATELYMAAAYDAEQDGDHQEFTCPPTISYSFHGGELESEIVKEFDRPEHKDALGHRLRKLVRDGAEVVSFMSESWILVLGHEDKDELIRIRQNMAELGMPLSSHPDSIECLTLTTFLRGRNGEELRYQASNEILRTRKGLDLRGWRVSRSDPIGGGRLAF